MGAERLRIFEQGEGALNEISALSELKHNPDANAVDLHEIEINESLIAYGKFLERKKNFAPLLADTDEVIEMHFSQIRIYRKNNPRILNGIQYSPVRMDRVTNQKSMALEQISRLEMGIERETEESIYYYNRAMANK